MNSDPAQRGRTRGPHQLLFEKREFGDEVGALDKEVNRVADLSENGYSVDRDDEEFNAWEKPDAANESDSRE